MADVAFLRKDDAEANKNKQAALKTLEAVTESVRQSNCHGMMVVAFERSPDEVDVELVVHRYYLAGGHHDMLALLGLGKLVLDEISEGVRTIQDFQ